MKRLHRIILFLFLTHSLSRQVHGFDLGMGFRFPMPPLILGRVDLQPVNSSTHWGDLLHNTLQHVLDHCKSVRFCNTTGLNARVYDSQCSECHPCSCDDGCYLRGDCCVDKQLRDVSEELVLNSQPHTVSPTSGCYSTFVTQYELATYALMVDKCSKDFKNEEVVEKCLNPSRNETFSQWPVWSPVSKTVYRNADCARCNNENLDDVLKWNLKIQCDRSVHLQQTKNVMTIIETALEEPTCQILFSRPEGCQTFPCRPVTGQYINTCNATGQRHVYDQALWKACEVFSGEMTVSGKTYKNVFCAMCNNDRLAAPGSCESDLPFPFFIEINGSSFQAQAEQSADGADERQCRCTDSEVYDQYEDKCRPLHCSMTRALTNNQCHSVLTNSTGLFYELALSLTPTDRHTPVPLTGTTPLTQAARNIRTSFMLQGSSDSGWDVMTHKFRVIAETEQVPQSVRSQDVLRVIRFKVHIKFSSNWPEPSGILENRLFALMRSQWNISVDGRPKRSFTASPLYFGPQKENQTKTFQSVSLLSSKGAIQEFVVDIPDPHIQDHGAQVLQTNYYLHISQAHKCAKVSFNVSRKPESGNALLVVNKTSGSVYHVASDEVIGFEFVELGEDGEVLVCADKLFDGAAAAGVSRNVPVLFFSPQLFVVTITVQALSMICLFLVLLTYMFFAELRSVADKNTMGLVITLILTVALTGGTVFGMGTESGCRILGVISHFVFLSAFTWAVICSFHYYYSFKCALGSWPDGCLNRYTIFQKYVVMSLVVPAVIVVVTVVGHVIESQGDCSLQVGYGKGICFVSGDYSFQIVACVPALVTVFSVVLFLWAAREQSCLRGERHESSLQAFHSLMAHVFLVLLMSITWLLKAVALLFEKDLVWYVSLVFCLILAMYVVIVFLCERRVFKLWRSWFLTSFLKDKKLRKGHKFSPVET